MGDLEHFYSSNIGDINLPKHSASDTVAIPDKRYNHVIVTNKAEATCSQGLWKSLFAYPSI